MNPKIASAAVVLVLSGCVATNNASLYTSHGYGVAGEGLHFLVGRNIHDAVAILGSPTSQQTMPRETIYVWNTSHNVNLPLLTTSSTDGSAGTLPVQWVPANYTCTIRLGVDAEGTVKQWQLEWNATSTDAVPAETYKAWSTTCLKADDQVAPTATETPPAGVTASGS